MRIARFLPRVKHGGWLSAMVRRWWLRFTPNTNDDFLKVTHSKWIANTVVRYIVRFYQSCDEVWAVNRQTGDVLRSYGYQGDIQIMPNGTDPFLLTQEQRQEALQRYPIPDGVPVLIFAGQQNLKKNPDLVLRACAMLKEHGLRVYLLMVGSGPDENKLHALSRTLGLEEQVLFTRISRGANPIDGAV